MFACNRKKGGEICAKLEEGEEGCFEKMPQGMKSERHKRRKHLKIWLQKYSSLSGLWFLTLILMKHSKSIFVSIPNHKSVGFCHIDFTKKNLSGCKKNRSKK